jgi:antiphage defense system Thoeris ThsB-like protein
MSRRLGPRTKAPSGSVSTALKIGAASFASLLGPEENEMAKHHRIFIAFAADDSKYRDFLVGQASNGKSPFSFTDMSVKEPWDSTWKSNCRTKIKGCDGLIALVSKNTASADGELWEIACAKDERIPVLGVYVDKNDKATIPAALSGTKVIEWTWDGIASWLASL